jgi:hypothetical protein
MTSVHFQSPVNNVKGYTPRGEIMISADSNTSIIHSFNIHPDFLNDEERYCFCVTISYLNFEAVMLITPSTFSFSNGNDEFISDDPEGIYENNNVFFG